MLGQLIRKISGGHSQASEFALDSMVFSLTTQVPRPTDNRVDERLLTILPVARLITDGWQDFCRIRNMSAGGLMAECTRPHDANEPVIVELNSSQQIAANIVWTRELNIGVKFDESIDLREILANGRPRIGFRPRPARLDIQCGATVKIDGLYHKVEVHDISLGGIKVELHLEECVGKTVLVTIESLRPVKGTIRWHRDGMAGIVFHNSLTFEEVAEWLGKRIDVASLRASTQVTSSRR